MRDREIDLLEVFRDIAKNFKKILIFSVVFAFIIGFIGSIRNSEPTTVNAKLLVVEDNKDLAINTNNDVLFINQSAAILESDKIFEQVFNEINLNNYGFNLDTTKAFDIFDIEVDSKTNLIIIKCKLDDIDLSKEAILSLVKHYKLIAPELINIKTIELISNSSVKKDNLLIGIGKWSIIGLFVGILICCGYFFTKHVFDDLIRTTDDVKTVFNYHIISYSKKNNDIREIADLIVSGKSKMINFICASNNDNKINFIVSLSKEIETANKKVLIIDLVKEELELDTFLLKNKERYDYILINSKSSLVSHDYINVSKLSDNNIIVINKEKDKFNDINKMNDDICFYKPKIMFISFIEQ